MRLITLVRACALGTTMTCAAAGTAIAQQTDTIPMRLVDDRVVFGAPAVAKGDAGGDAAGRTVVLEHRGGDGSWRAIGRATVAGDGDYRVSGEVPGRGRLRVTLVPPEGTATTAAASQSKERRIAVVSRVSIAKRRLHVRAGRPAVVAGQVAPGTAGRTVRLQVRRKGAWRTLDRGATAAGGHYRLRGKAAFVGSLPVRVHVAGGGPVDPRRRGAGRLNAYRVAHASWYGPGLYGNTLGCGGTLTPGTHGVAHKTLPCGTKVTFRHRGRSIRVRVIDRGPYIAGREYDLTEATARAIGFTGHGAILATR